MLQFWRSVSDTLGVGFLMMQLIKLIGMVFTLVGPLKFVSSLFAGLFPLIAGFFKITFGWSVNGLDVMAICIAMSGSLIVWSSVAREEAMGTRYIFRFFMIPYAFLVILIAIIVQVTTPIVELNTFNNSCKSEAAEVTFYGSTCQEMTRQLSFWDSSNSVPAEPTPADAGPAVDPPPPPTDTGDDSTGISFILAMVYLVIILPLISIFVFFFKRLSVNKLLKRVAIAAGSAVGLALLSTAYASVFGA